MGFVIEYVAIYAPWIYAICGLVALYQIYKIWLVRAERKQAVFSLEREKAVHDTYNIFAIAMILVAAMGITYFTSTTLAQAVAPLVDEARSPSVPLPFVPTPTNTPLPIALEPTSTPLPTASTEALDDAEETSGEEAAEFDVTVDLPENSAPVEAATPEPPPPVVEAPACPDSRSLILQPGNNASVSGVINLIGTATHENFQFYKVEFAPGANASSGFGYLDGGNNPVISNFLVSVDTFALGNGPWTLRLEVVDQTGNYIPRCQVTINVNN